MTKLEPPPEAPAAPSEAKARAKARDPGLELIAILKIAKAVLITGLAIGLFRAIDKNLGDIVRNVTIRLRIDPENHLIRLALEKLTSIDPKKVHTFGILSVVYASELYLEGLGLWFNQAWAKYLVVVATGFWIPEEGYACVHHFGWWRFSLLLVNVGVLIYVVWVLWRQRQKRSPEPGTGD